MDRSQLWGRRLLSGGCVALALVGVRAATQGGTDDLLGAVRADRAPHCQVQDLSVGYAVGQDGALGRYAVTGARLDGPDLCVGAAVSVTFTATDGRPLGRASGHYDRAAPTLPLDPGPALTVDEVASLAVVLFD